MKIRVAAPGKIKEKWLAAGVEEFTKRLSRYCKVEIAEVADAPDSLAQAEALLREARDLMEKIPERSFLCALDISGQSMDSEAFATKMSEWFRRGDSQITFVIGGSRGLDSSVLEKADFRYSFGPLTLTHGLARLILLEQCYRAFRILNNEPYHK